MTRFPTNRACPLTGEPHSGVLGYIRASTVIRCNATYRPEALAILGLQPEDEFPIVQGPTGFVFAGWLPTKDFLARVYEDVIDHARTMTETIWYRRGLLEFAAALFSLAERIGPDRPPLKLLDYGCGYGSMLRILGVRDVEVIGFEPSGARSGYSALAGGHILTNLSEVAQAGPFDLFVCTEVLEHMAHPRDALTFMREHATAGALLAVTVPHCPQTDVQAALAATQTDGPVAAIYNPWEHLNYFTAESLRSLLADEGFAVVSDFGRSRAPAEAARRLGDLSPAAAIVGGARAIRRALRATPSTELFCQCR
jgi:hypothetical protein